MIGGAEWRVKWEKVSDDDYGECIPEERLIRINPDKPADTFEATLFHEKLHAALAMSGLSTLLSDETEEAIVLCLENLVFPLYRRK